MRLPAVEEVGDAVTAHDQSRVYPANSGSFSDRRCPQEPAVERPDLLDRSVRGISGKPHCHSSARTKDDGLENRCLAGERANPATQNSQICMGKLWWRVLGSNQRRLSRRFYRPLPLATRATRLVLLNASPGCSGDGWSAYTGTGRTDRRASVRYRRFGRTPARRDSRSWPMRRSTW
jgi:hypothetical protein